jgi:PST family polysaccharide transporter
VSTSRGLLRSGSAATLAQLVRLVSIQGAHMVAGRFVSPAEWGAWAWLEALFLLLASVRDLGVTNHVMRLRPMPFGTFLRLELVWGTALAAALFVTAPLVAGAYAGGGPDLVDGIRVMTAGLVLEGLGAVALIWFEARLAIERTLSAEFLRVAGYAGGVIAGSLAGLGFWSFVAGTLAGQVLFAFELWRGARGEIVLHHAAGTSLRLVVESLPLMGVWLLTTAVGYGDAFVVGRLFESTAVGLYLSGFALAFLVFRILQQPFARSLFPALVVLGDRPEEQFRAYRLATVLFLALEVPASLLVAANADLILLVLRGEDYLGAAPFLRLLAFAPLVDPLGRFGGEFLVARGQDRARVASLGLQLAGLVVGGALLCRALASPLGMAWAHFLPLGAPIVWLALWRAGGGQKLGRLLVDLIAIYLVPLAPFALAWWAAGENRWLRLALTVAATLFALAWSWRRHGAEFRDFFRQPAAPVPVSASHLPTH